MSNKPQKLLPDLTALESVKFQPREETLPSLTTFLLGTTITTEQITNALAAWKTEAAPIVAPDFENLLEAANE